MFRDNQKYQRVAAVAVIALLIAAVLMWSNPRGSLAAPARYAFTSIAILESPAPGGGNFTFDFEPTGINNRGDVAFTADLTTGGEGVFVGRQGQVSQILRHGQAAPGGGNLSFAELGRLGFNDGGDLAIPFTLDPFTFPIGLNAGVFRYSHSSQTLSAVVSPGNTAPGGGTFDGVFFNTSLNNRGDIVFSGIVGGASGLFLADRLGAPSKVVRAGDPAPGGGAFDNATNGWINDGGDIAFGGHVAGEECINIFSPFVCGESVYLKSAATGVIQSIAHQGDPAPGGGAYRLAFGPVVNSRGDIVFIGDLTPAPDSGSAFGVFLFTKGATIAVARPGNPMPGGGTFVTAGFQDATYHLNNLGDVSFAAGLDTDVDGDGIADTGMYVSSKGSVRLVARTGTDIPGLGTVAYLGLAPFTTAPAGTGGIINDRGQVLFFATLTDGRGVLLVATPRP